MSFQVGDRVREREEAMLANNPLTSALSEAFGIHSPSEPQTGTVTSLDDDGRVIVRLDPGFYSADDLEGWPYDEDELERIEA